MRRALAAIAVTWCAWIALESLATRVIGLPGPWRHDCHRRLACHPESRAVVVP